MGEVIRFPTLSRPARPYVLRGAPLWRPGPEALEREMERLHAQYAHLVEPRASKSYNSERASD